MENRIKAALNQAEYHLTQATEGLAKPEEDVVPYSVCKHAYEAVINYLSAYVMERGLDLPSPRSVENLLILCRQSDSVFEELHLSPFYHPKATEDVWMNLDMAHDFLQMAELTKNIVLHQAAGFIEK